MRTIEVRRDGPRRTGGRDAGSRVAGEGGFVTLWVLGLTVAMLAIAGVSIDLWRAVATQRSVSTAVDSAAVAGSSGIDEAAYRSSGGQTVVLDVARARSLAESNLASQPDAASLVDVVIDVTPDRISVRAGRQVDFTLVRVLQVGQDPAVLHATATADPRRTSP